MNWIEKGISVNVFGDSLHNPFNFFNAGNVILFQIEIAVRKRRLH